MVSLYINSLLHGHLYLELDSQKECAVQESSYLIIFHPPSQKKNVNDKGAFKPALNNHHLPYLMPATQLNKDTLPE
jgi:hypothetical protein